jgi:large subunit ribosomal protein L4
MTTLEVKTMEGQPAGTIDCSDAVFGVEPNVNCVRVALHSYWAGQRAGTNSTKTRNEVRGGGRKPWRQKGTGRARQGSIRAVQWRGGGIAFGPHPRDYTLRINRKVKRSAMTSALSELVRSGRLVVVEDLTLAQPKTRRLAEVLDVLDLRGTTLIVTLEKDDNVYLSARNMPFVDCTHAGCVNVFELLAHDFVVITRGALQRLEEVYA